MNLYHIECEGRCWDVNDAFIVAASSEEEALKLAKEDSYSMLQYEKTTYEITLLGIADKRFEKSEVIFSHFKPG